MEPTILFLIDVSRKLSPEGVHLLKTLYCGTLPLGKLARLEDPRHLHDLTVDRSAPSSINEVPANEISSQDSLALFVHRLELLVPQSREPDKEKRARELRSKDVGAQACLDSLEQHGITRPTLTVAISEESKMLECLVKCYVNMAPKQRTALKRELGGQVGIHPDQVTIFDIFAALFTDRERENGCESVVSLFISSMQKAHSSLQTFTDLEQHLSACNVPHGPIPRPKKENKPEPDIELEDEVTPLIKKTHHSIVKRERRKLTRYCSCLCVPVLLGVLVIVVAMPIFSRYLKDDEFYCEDSGYVQLPDPSKCASVTLPSSTSVKAAILVGKVNIFWYDSLTISQIKNNDRYEYTTVNFFMVPYHQLHNIIHKMEYSCSRDYPFVEIIFYFLKGSKLNITLCVQATSQTYPGARNLTICTNYDCYFSFENYLVQYQIFVAPNETNCTSIQFTAQNNSFHYLTTGSSHGRIANSTLKSYQIRVSLLYLNSSVWEEKEPVCSSNNNDFRPCNIEIERESIFQAEEYAIVATVSSETDDVGNLLIEEHNRKLAYAVPAIAAVLLMTLGLLIVSVLIGALCLAKRKTIE